MKVSLNSQFLQGPYGGGMQFANYMRAFLEKKGMSVVNHLKDDDIDIILHVSPFPFLTKQASAYSFFDAYAYKLKHPQTVIIERVNEGDERKGTRYMNKLLVDACKKSDHVVFIASWLRPILERAGLSKDKPSSVILNGADATIFNTAGKKFWDGQEKMRIVTHHWSPNVNKGHDIYHKLDDLLGSELGERFEFTYIGSAPKELEYKHTNIIPPLSGKELADELKRHHVYITASKNEPAGMHHIEGALSGLPLLYIDSGALPEYCGGYGLEFDESNLGQKLLEMRERYTEFTDKLRSYDNTAERMGKNYLELMETLIAERSKHLICATPLETLLASVYPKLYIAGFRILKKSGII